MDFDHSSTLSNDKWRISYLEELPFEILIHIFSFLEEGQLCHISSTSRVWNTLTSHSLLWRPFYQAKWKLLNIKYCMPVVEAPPSPSDAKNLLKTKKARRARTKTARKKDNHDDSQFNTVPKRKNSLNNTPQIKVGCEWKIVYMERFLQEKDEKIIFSSSPTHPLQSLEHWQEAFSTLVDACSTLEAEPSVSQIELTPVEEVKLLEHCIYITAHKYSEAAGSIATRFILFSHTLPTFVEFRFIRSTANMGLYECLSFKTFDGQTGSVLRSEEGISEQLQKSKIDFVRIVLAVQALDWLSFFRFLLIASMPHDIELQDQLYENYLAGLED